MPPNLDSHITTDVKPEMLSGVKNGNGIPHDRFDIICGIAHVRTNRKGNIFMQRRLGQIIMYIGVGQGSSKKSRPYLAQAYTTLVVLVFNRISKKKTNVRMLR